MKRQQPKSTIPLALALFVRARYEETAIGLVHTMSMATNLSLVVLFIGYFVGYFSEIIGIIGWWNNGAILLVAGAAPSAACCSAFP